MLTKFRKYLTGHQYITGRTWNVKSLVAMILFGAIILVFVLFGFPQHQEGIGGSVARVGSAYISLIDLNKETERVQAIYSQFFGGQNAGVDMSRQYQMQALSTLVDSELVNQRGEKYGIFVSDQELMDFITVDLPYFKENGRFSREKYLGLLSQNQFTAGEFENKIKKERREQRLRRIMESALWASDLEKKKNAELKKTQMKIEYLRFNKDELAKSVEPSTSEAQEALKKEDFKKQVANDYQMTKGSMQRPEEVSAQHILIRFDAKVAGSAEKALAQIKDIEKQTATSDFGALAEKFSEDPGSKKEKGNLGSFSRGKMVPEFEEVAFKLPIGKISEPVKSSYGYHLIKVISKKPAYTPELKDVEVSIAQKLIAQQRVTQPLEALEKDLKDSNLVAVEAWAKKMNLKWQESAAFDLSQEQIPGVTSPQVLEAAFKLSAEKKLYPQMIREESQRYVIKLKETKIVANLKTETQGPNRFFEIYRNWLEEEKKKMPITYNTKVLKQVN